MLQFKEGQMLPQTLYSTFGNKEVCAGSLCTLTIDTVIQTTYYFIKEHSNILYLGMAKEFSSLP